MAFTKITNAGFGLTTGTLVGVAASFSSTVSVGGTLTYEDVTNVDSVGLITARNGIEVTDKGVQVGTGATVDSAAANTLTFLTGGSERVRVTSAGVVGVNNSSPSSHAQLDIVGSSYWPLLVKTTSTNGGGIAVKDKDDVTSLYTGSGGSSWLTGSAITDGLIRTTNNLLFATNGNNERLRITSAGQIRIGSFGAPSNKNTVTPLAHVDGSGVSGGFQVNRHTSVGGGGAQLLLSATRGSSVTGHTILQDGDGIGTVEFEGSDGGEFVSAASIQAQVDGTPGDDDMPGRLLFKTTADGASSPTERLRITSTGRMGLGLTSPNSNLHVKGGSDSTDNLLLTLQSNGVANDGSLSTGLRLINSTSDSSIHGGEIRAIRSSASAAALTFSTYNGTSIAEAVRIDSSGNFGVGTASPGYKIEVTQGSGNSVARFTGANSANLVFRNATSNVFELNAGGSNDELSFGTAGNNERLRISDTGKVQVRGTRGGSLQPSDNDTLELYTSASNGAANTGSGLTFFNHDGNGYEQGGTIQVAKENGSINNTAGYMRFSTRANNADTAERMRIGSGGDVLIARTSASISNIGHYFLSVGAFNHTRSGDTVGEINRLANDGTLINFRQADSLEGSISVSGSSVSYNGGHLARWSQLASGAARIEILRGSVLSNLDEMCEWGEEDNEQLNRMKVSDVEGDINVSGVFQAWDDDDDTYTNDFYCAMTGDFVIRIAQGTTVARGDLLMSAGDGTAKPQDDDIVRSKTIAKVTSTTVSTTYSDGSYCVPCVLMAC